MVADLPDALHWFLVACLTLVVAIVLTAGRCNESCEAACKPRVGRGHLFNRCECASPDGTRWEKR